MIDSKHIISFIVIGRNEGAKLARCFKSIYNVLKINKIFKAEIIYVDSSSSDNSIEIAQQFSDVSILKLTGILNPAIARNVGANKSSGEVLFFIDGDMQLDSGFLQLVFSETEGLTYPFISGQLKNYNFDTNGSFLNNSWQYKEVLKSDNYFSTTGGIFIIERRLWEMVNGMDIRFVRGEDLDLGLRLSKMGFKILRKKEIIANHFTTSYTHHKRMWTTLYTGDVSFTGPFLFKKHFLNFPIYPRVLKNYYTLAAFFIFSIISIVTFNPIGMLGYILIIFVKTLKAGQRSFFRFVELSSYYIARDAVFFINLFLPLPGIKESDVKFEEVV